MEQFLRLPYELKEYILGFLNPIDIYMFSNVCEEVKTIYYSKLNHYLDLSMDLRLNLTIMRNIFQQKLFISNVTTLNINGIYWIPAYELVAFLRRMRNLETVYALGTKLEMKNLSEKKLRIPQNTENLLEIYISKNKVTLCNGNFKTERLLYGCSCEPILTKYSFHINDIYWINEILSYVNIDSCDVKDNHKRINDSKMRREITYREIMENPLQTPEEVFREMSEIHELTLRNPNREIIKNTIIRPDYFTYLKRLKKLYIDVIINYSSQFLKVLFTKCTELETLRICDQGAAFQLAFLKYTKVLQELSFVGKGNFQIDRLLMDLTENKHIQLKRIFLKFDKFAKLSVTYLSKFLARHRQLVCFVIQCDMPKTTVQQIQKIFDENKRHVQCFYKIYDNTCIVRNSIPLMHLDLVNSYLII